MPQLRLRRARMQRPDIRRRGAECGGGSGSQLGDGGPPSNRYGPSSDMYELFSCGEQTMNQIAHGYVMSRATDDAVYQPSPPMQPHPDYSQPCQGFQYYQPSPQQQYQLPSPHCQTYYQPSSPRGLSYITSPPLAISHRHRSPGMTTSRTSLFARGHSGVRGITACPPATHHLISTIILGTRATGTRLLVMF
ncbi:hypothetical protein PIB30_023925 [Stylosanthes scabra]|uniref:Uncharacterized protein n=1 Tax=Stylosanthes scabra TaxID=79078 RepID=A0ABU6V8Q6_9FABA|nr:hypothetical protein [Stylosanthes scabra]